MKSLSLKTLLAMCTLLSSAGPVFSQSDVSEESPFSTPLNRMFNDKHVAIKETPAEKLNRKAIQAIGKKEWKEAFSNLMGAMEEDPNDINTYINFGIFHFVRKEYPSSEKALLKAFELDPKNAKANYHYSKVMTLKGEKDLALKAAILATEKADPPDWKYQRWLGDLHERTSNYPAAVDCFSEALVLLEEKLTFVSDGISNEESKLEVIETYTDTEIISDGNGIRQVEVDKFRTDYKEAPEEWHTMKATYANQIAILTKRKEQASAQAKL